jgi:hypothetical protein
MVAVSMVRTTPPKEEKVGTSLAEAPTAQALVARPRSKVPDDTRADDNPELLNFGRVQDRLPDELLATELLA